VVPCDLLRRAGCEVRLVSAGSEIIVKSTHNINIKCDIMLESLILSDMEMLFLPGGGKGVENLDKLPELDKLLKYAIEKNLYIAAICAAPSLLGKRGLLKGKKAVSYPSFQEFLYGAQVENSRVVCDGKIITAIGAGAAFEFGLKLVSVLKDSETAEKIKRSIY
jgi:4-methyl-5(b-hydroxyethyl)-thiazole monophosphate biosynthesis